jgi:alkylation response protein AidB-like acyl-CoA dehydrogenase
MTAGVAIGEVSDVAGLLLPGGAGLQRLIDRVDAEVLDRERERRPPFREFELVREARLGALRLPVEQGGAGASLRELFEVVIEISAADPNLAHSLRNHFVFTENRLRLTRDGSDDEWLRKVSQGLIFGAAATELGIGKAGRRDQNFTTRLSLTPDGYRLNGTKFYSTGNLYADWIVVSAQTADDTNIRVVIPTDRPGVILDDDWDGIGQRLTGSGTTRLADVHVELAEILDESPTWFNDVPYQATLPQLYLTAVIAGILRRVVRDAVALVHGRQRTFYHAVGDSPADDPILQQTVGQIASIAYAAETVVLAAADALGASTDAGLAGEPDNGRALHASLRAAKAKVVVDEIAQRAASMVFDVGGATAVRQSVQLDRHWRNIRTLASHNPSTYKAKWIGGYEINGTPLPTGAFF